MPVPIFREPSDESPVKRGFNIESEDIILVVSESGEMSGFPTQYCSGDFEGESKIQLYLRWGGFRGNITHIVDGVKK